MKYVDDDDDNYDDDGDDDNSRGWSTKCRLLCRDRDNFTDADVTMPVGIMSSRVAYDAHTIFRPFAIELSLYVLTNALQIIGL